MPPPMRDEPPLDGDTLVLRGGLLQVRSLVAAADTCELREGLYAITVFADPARTPVELWQDLPQLNRYSECRMARLDPLRALGCDTLPTWGFPHYSLRLPSPMADDQWEALRATFEPVILEEGQP